MKKTFGFFAVIWALLLAIFNVIVFVTPSEAGGMTKFGGAFWSGYVFITLAFIGQLVVAYHAFNAKNIENFFYNVSLIRISWTGLILILVFGSLCMVIPNLPNWVGIILCFTIMGFTAIAVVKASMATDLVTATDEKIKVQTFFIKSLTVDAEGLLARAQSDDIKAECKKVYEAIRYSDPMSNDALATTESQITLKFAELADAVSSDDAEAVKKAAREVCILVDDRNKKCRLLK